MSTATASIPFRKPSHSGYMCHLNDERGRPVKLKAFGLHAQVMIKYPWRHAPDCLKELCLHYPGEPDYVVVVPNAMRFDDLPEDAFEIHQLADGYICFL